MGLMRLMGLMGLMGEEPPGDNPNFRVRRGRETRAERGRKFRIPHSAFPSCSAPSVSLCFPLLRIPPRAPFF